MRPTTQPQPRSNAVLRPLNSSASVTCRVPSRELDHHILHPLLSFTPSLLHPSYPSLALYTSHSHLTYAHNHVRIPHRNVLFSHLHIALVQASHSESLNQELTHKNLRPFFFLHFLSKYTGLSRTEPRRADHPGSHLVLWRTSPFPFLSPLCVMQVVCSTKASWRSETYASYSFAARVMSSNSITAAR